MTLFMSSTLWSGVDKDRALMELAETRLAAFGETPESCMKMNVDAIDEFLTAIAQIQDYVDENSKNKHGIKDETLSKASKTFNKKTNELIIIVGAIAGTRTKDGMQSLQKLLKEYEDRLKETEESLGKEKFEDDKKKANEMLGEGIKHLKELIGHVTKATEHRTKWLERPVKKKEQEKDKVAEQNNQEQKNDKNQGISDAKTEQPKKEQEIQTREGKEKTTFEANVANKEKSKLDTPARRQAAAQAQFKASYLPHVLNPAAVKDDYWEEDQD